MNKSINKVDVFTIVLGAIIGWGAFMLPGTMFLESAGVINTAIGLILGALAIIIIEKNYAIMLRENRDNGGEFSYTYNNMGSKHGFIVGWFLTIAYIAIIPLNATAFPLIIEKLFDDVLKFGYLYTVAGYEVYFGEVLTSSIVIILFAYLNINGIKKTSKYQNIIVFTLLVSVFFIFICMLKVVGTDFIYENYIVNYKFSFNEIFKIFAIAPWAYIGFDAIAQLSDEFNFSHKKATVIAIFSLIFGAIVYNILNIIAAMVYSIESLHELDWATGTAVANELGTGFFIVLVIALTGAVWSGINGFFICTSKLIGALSDYKVVPQVLGKKSDKNVNKNAIIFIVIVSLVAPWFGRVALNWIVDMSSMGASVAYLYVSYIAIKKSENIKQKLYAVIGTIISGIFILLLIVPISPAALPLEPLIALIVWIILGIVYYRNNSNEFK